VQRFSTFAEEAERRGSMMKAASERHAWPGEACKLLDDLSKAEFQMMKYVRAKTVACGFPENFLVQLNAGYENTERMRERVCAYPPEGTVTTDFGDPAFKQH
jgi:hypothetical protein